MSEVVLLDDLGSLEIERKWLIDPRDIPHHLGDLTIKAVEQVYHHGTDDDWSLRTQRKGGDCTATLKGPGSLARRELDVPISHQSFEALAEGKEILYKTHIQTPEGYEVKLFHGDYQGLNIVEVEFEDEFHMEEFSAPEWFGNEVTDNEEFYSANLTKKSETTHPSHSKADVIEQIANTTKEGLVEFDGIKMRRQQKRPLLVALTGPTASGKSTFASELTDEFGASALNLDHYCHGYSKLTDRNADQPWKNWDLPLAYDIDQAAVDLSRLAQKQVIQVPNYNYKTGESDGSTTVYPNKVIVVEGLFALSSLIRNQVDVGVYVDAPLLERVKRRIERDQQRTTDKPEEIFQFIMDVAEPAGVRYITPQKDNADYYINNK